MSNQVKINTIPLGRGEGVTGFDVVEDGLAGQYLSNKGTGNKPEWTSPKGSIEINGGQLQLTGDQPSPGSSRVYGTDGSGNKGWFPSGGSSGLPIIAPGDRRKTIQVLDNESGWEISPGSHIAGNSVSLLTILNDAEVADVLSGTNLIDISAKIAAAVIDLATNSPGFTLDMSMLHGNDMTLTQDWFGALPIAEGRIITGPVKVLVNFNNMNFRIPGRMTWEARGTVIESSTTITGVANGEGGLGYLVNTYYGGFGRTCSSATLNTVTVSDVTGIEVGCLIAVYGTQRDFNFQFTLGANINSTDTIIPIVGASTIDPGIVMLRLSGTEYVYGLYSGGVLDTTYPGGGRGMLGSTAVAHSSGAAVLLMQSMVRTVVGISGNTLTLSSNIDITFANAEFRYGTVGSTIIGDLTIDGKDDRTLPSPGATWSCLGGTLSANFNTSGSIHLLRGVTGGYMLMGARGAKLEIETINLCGRPADGLGASGWLFGYCQDINITVKQTANGNISNAIDNKSSGLFSMGLWQPNILFNVVHELVLSHNIAHDVTASSDGYCLTYYAQCSQGLAGIFDGVPQSPGPILAQNVTIEIRGYSTFYIPTGNCLYATGNSVRLGTYVCGDTSVLTLDGASNKSRVVFKNSGTTNWNLMSETSGALNLYNGAFSSGVSLTSQSATSWSALSDVRIKTNIEPLSVLDRLSDFQAVSYTNKLTGVKEIGVIAQDEISRVPEFVNEGSGSNEDNITSIADPRLWKISYDRYGVEALQGVKELLQIINQQQIEIDKLKLKN